MLEFYPCLKICFWDTSRVVRDFYCALQIIADGVSGKSQRRKRLTAYGMIGEASANKGMQKTLVEMPFSLYNPPKSMGYIAPACGLSVQCLS